MQWHAMRTLGAPWIVILVLSSAACTRVVDRNLKAPPVLAEPLPLTVGVYYSDELRGHELTNQPPVEIDFKVKTGAAHVSFFDDLFSHLFIKTIPVTEKSLPSPNGQHMDAVIEPTIVSVNYAFVDDGGFNMKVPVDVRYAIDLYGFGGEAIHSWMVSGEAEAEGVLGYLAIEDGVEIAMRDAAARFVVEFLGDGALKTCLDRLTGDLRSANELKSCFDTP